MDRGGQREILRDADSTRESRAGGGQTEAQGRGTGREGERSVLCTRAWPRRAPPAARLCPHRCIFAHVRAASETSVISEQNCHPFRFGRLLFQHNGHIEQFHRIKRRLFSVLRDDVYEWCEGTTDSEACFALLLSLIDPSELAHGGPIEPKLLQVRRRGRVAPRLAPRCAARRPTAALTDRAAAPAPSRRRRCLAPSPRSATSSPMPASRPATRPSTLR